MTRALSMRRFGRVVVLASIALTCARPSRQAEDQGLEAVIQQYLDADTGGNVYAANSLADWRECEWVPSTDMQEPVSAAAVVRTERFADSAVVWLHYRVLGRSSGGTFVAEARDDTVRVLLLRVDGSYRIQCGDFHPNHPGVAAFERGWLSALDSISTVSWRRAREDAKTSDQK